ncbi:MAG: hypothetical protein LZF62_140061 [Nitrospira sp.]|nr:MAG: hypothetical protein LZF62_140061 [Nitrospira sp.]
MCQKGAGAVNQHGGLPSRLVEAVKDRGGAASGRKHKTTDRDYQMPRPIITTPRAIHPKTPTAMMVSRLIPLGASSTWVISFFMVRRPLARSVIDEPGCLWLPEGSKQRLCPVSVDLESRISRSRQSHVCVNVERRA